MFCPERSENRVALVPRARSWTYEVRKQRNVLGLAEQRIYFSAGFVRETYAAEHSQGVHVASAFRVRVCKDAGPPRHVPDYFCACRDALSRRAP